MVLRKRMSYCNYSEHKVAALAGRDHVVARPGDHDVVGDAGVDDVVAAEVGPGRKARDDLDIVGVVRDGGAAKQVVDEAVVAEHDVVAVGARRRLPVACDDPVSGRAAEDHVAADAGADGVGTAELARHQHPGCRDVALDQVENPHLVVIVWIRAVERRGGGSGQR